MPTTRLAYLFQRYVDKTATPEEVAEFMHLADQGEHAVEIQQLMEKSWTQFGEAEDVFTAEQSSAMLRASLQSDAAVIRRITWRRFTMAAALLGILGSGIWWVAHSRTHSSLPVVQRIAPPKTVPVAGSNKAELVLGDGSTMTLDSTHNGLLTTQGNTPVVQLAGGRLAYGATQGNGTLLYNTLRTPRGGQYQLDLPDGSRVWLNAATSLRYPTAFTGPHRTVELAGEAYFEIAENKNQPFRVKTGNMTVDVLGTHFNIMAYSDEASINTTLLQGAVQVETGTGSETLRPGEAARMNAVTRELTVEAVDTDQAVAWKNGLFQFDGATLETVMRQISRWYDVDIRYEENVTRHFSGLISRNEHLQDVLQLLDHAVKTRFILEGRTVVVRPR